MPGARRTQFHDPVLAAVSCSACALSLSSFASFPALMPRLFESWQLTTSAAAWVNAAFYAGYMLASPVLTTLTDRVDARRLVLASCALGALAAAAFAAFGAQLWAAVVTRAISGAATAGSFMPGLRALTDRTQLAKQARYIGFYMASFALGTSLSYAVCEALAAPFGVEVALWSMTLGPLAALLLWGSALKPRALPQAVRGPLLPDPRPVFRNRAALGFVCCYGLHTWELFTLRSWGVSFLSFAQQRAGFAASFWWAPATVLALANVLTAPASVLGVEAAQRLGRVRWIGGVMVASGLSLGLLGVSQGLPSVLACFAILASGALMGADSATLTSGLVEVSPADQRGLGMAVHTTVGFAGAFLGPLVFGLLLDAAGGVADGAAWVTSFAVSGAVTLVVGFFVRRLVFAPP
jgi:MFS family permease